MAPASHHQPTLAFAGPGFLAPAALKASRHQQQRQRQQGWLALPSLSLSSVPSSNSSSSSGRRARGFGGVLSMSAEGGGEAGTEAAATAEVPEATKRLLEQAAKIRAEVREKYEERLFFFFFQSTVPVAVSS